PTADPFNGTLVPARHRPGPRRTVARQTKRPEALAHHRRAAAVAQHRGTAQVILQRIVHRTTPAGQAADNRHRATSHRHIVPPVGPAGRLHLLQQAADIVRGLPAVRAAVFLAIVAPVRIIVDRGRLPAATDAG